MHLWQFDPVGGIYLADGRECTVPTGIDDHSGSWSSIEHGVGRLVEQSVGAVDRGYRGLIGQ